MVVVLELQVATKERPSLAESVSFPGVAMNGELEGTYERSFTPGGKKVRSQFGDCILSRMDHVLGKGARFGKEWCRK